MPAPEAAGRRIGVIVASDIEAQPSAGGGEAFRVGHRPPPTVDGVIRGVEEDPRSQKVADVVGGAGLISCPASAPMGQFGVVEQRLGHETGMRRFRELTTERVGFYNTVGFNDDTRAFLSLPARHDMAPRVDCAYLATLVASGRLAEDEAYEVAADLSYRLGKKAYRP